MKIGRLDENIKWNIPVKKWRLEENLKAAFFPQLERKVFVLKKKEVE